MNRLAQIPVRIIQLPLRIFRPVENATLTRIRRRNAIMAGIGRRVSLLIVALFIAGYLWLLAIPSPRLGRGTYIDENALQPGQVNTYWNWDDVHNADRYLERMEQMRDSNATSEQRISFFLDEFRKMGLPASSQNYKFTVQSQSGDINGTNVYAILSSPRASGVEAMVISASWISRTDEGSGQTNLRGVATVLALAKFLKQYSLWAKDLVFVLSDGYLDGMHAWLSAYHGSTQSNLIAEPLTLSSGVIWTALNIDYPGHSFSHLGIFHEGLNGRLPNQDLLNSFQRIAHYRTGVPVILYDHTDNDVVDLLPKWIPSALRDNSDVQAYARQARNVIRHVKYQASGRGSGVHGLFHQFRIDAFTIYALPAMGPHGFHAIELTFRPPAPLPSIIESTLRTTNNLLERLHASFFFYIMTGPERFLKIGSYLPSGVLISVGMMFTGLRCWVQSAKDSNWQWGRSSVLRLILGSMLPTHALGGVMYLLIRKGWIGSSTPQTLTFLATLYALPFLYVFPAFLTLPGAGYAPVLKSLNLCFASTVISIIAVLNFSLSATTAALLGLPLALSSGRFGLTGYTAYFVFATGWLLKPEFVQQLLWDWEVLGVWTLPFVCVVGVPLVGQAAVVCLL
ncbi:Glycosyl phosphatidyl inositol protein transamidase complex subunit [Marasmius crinis-equi]|uniref:Glycosyl phosphatidyl inositol protein transamidase complex subunit n=1 Tax=Marasmius crinis-equi TaxID=585013 RepID=A0ABR3FRE5_9AGAR